MKYTYGMFLEDSTAIAYGLKLTQGIKVPRDEWPVAHFADISYGINQNTSLARSYGYFHSTYGTSGTDFLWRWQSTIDFLSKYQVTLGKLGLVNRSDSGELEAHEELVRILLDSFRDPEPPVIFPTSPLHKTLFQFAVGKVVKAYKTRQFGAL